MFNVLKGNGLELTLCFIAVGNISEDNEDFSQNHVLEERKALCDYRISNSGNNIHNNINGLWRIYLARLLEKIMLRFIHI